MNRPHDVWNTYHSSSLDKFRFETQEFVVLSLRPTMTTLPHCLQYDYRLHRGWFRGDFLPLQARSRTAASQEQNRISRKIRARFRSLYSTLYCTYMLQFYVWYSQHDQCLCSRMYWIAMFSPSTTLSLQVLLIKIKFVVSGANHMPIQSYHTSLTIIIYIYIYMSHICLNHVQNWQNIVISRLWRWDSWNGIRYV